MIYRFVIVASKFWQSQYNTRVLKSRLTLNLYQNREM